MDDMRSLDGTLTAIARRLSEDGWWEEVEEIDLAERRRQRRMRYDDNTRHVRTLAELRIFMLGHYPLESVARYDR